MNRHFLDFHSLQPTSCVEKVRSQILSLRQPDWGCSTSSTPRAQNPADFCRCFYSGELSGRLELLSTGAGECIFLRGLRTSSWSPVPNLLEANAASANLFQIHLPQPRKTGAAYSEVQTEFVSSIPAAPASHSGVRPGSPRNARMGRKSRLFAHSISSPDSQFADLEVEIAESLRPCPRIFPFCGDYRRRLVRSRLPPDLGTLFRPSLRS